MKIEELKIFLEECHAKRVVIPNELNFMVSLFDKEDRRWERAEKAGKKTNHKI